MIERTRALDPSSPSLTRLPSILCPLPSPPLPHNARHKENKRIRLLMRQEKTMKVIANHMVDPRIVMQPNVGSDRSWVWTAYDYAEGDLREEVFALKFGKPQDAEEFKKAFDEAKKEMRAFVAVDEEPEKEGDAGAAGDAAEALGGLKLEKKEKEKDKEGKVSPKRGSSKSPKKAEK
jgi:hypothetical protein